MPTREEVEAETRNGTSASNLFLARLCVRRPARGAPCMRLSVKGLFFYRRRLAARSGATLRALMELLALNEDVPRRADTDAYLVAVLMEDRQRDVLAPPHGLAHF